MVGMKTSLQIISFSTTMVRVSVATHPAASVPVTKYVVVSLGDAQGAAQSLQLKLIAGLHW
jgi:hypothetical protein